MFRDIGGLVLLLWRTLQALPLTLRHRRKVAEQFYEIGMASLLMVCILSFFIGGVLALLLKQAPSVEDRRHKVRVAWGGGCPIELWRQVEKRFGIRVVDSSPPDLGKLKAMVEGAKIVRQEVGKS